MNYLAQVSKPDFWSGGSAYNRLALAIGAISAVATIAGLAYTMWQVTKIRSASDAAKEASEGTLSRMDSIAAVVRLGDLIRRVGTVIHLIEAKEYEAARNEIHEFRLGVAQLAEEDQGVQPLPQDRWQSLQRITRKVEIGLALEPGENAPKECVDRMRKVQVELAGAAAKAATNLRR
jgi:hypothetical protein